MILFLQDVPCGQKELPGQGYRQRAGMKSGRGRAGWKPGRQAEPRCRPRDCGDWRGARQGTRHSAADSRLRRGRTFFGVNPPMERPPCRGEPIWRSIRPRDCRPIADRRLDRPFLRM